MNWIRINLGRSRGNWTQTGDVRCGSDSALITLWLEVDRKNPGFLAARKDIEPQALGNQPLDYWVLRPVLDNEFGPQIP